MLAGGAGDDDLEGAGGYGSVAGARDSRGVVRTSGLGAAGAGGVGAAGRDTDFAGGQFGEFGFGGMGAGAGGGAGFDYDDDFAKGGKKKGGKKKKKGAFSSVQFSDSIYISRKITTAALVRRSCGQT